MKYLVVTYLLLKCSCWVCCQKQKLDCVLLQKSLENRVFNQYFLIDKFPNQTLIIIDSSNFFQHCKISNVFNRKIEIRQTLSLKKDNHEIVIDYAKEKGKKITIAFFKPVSNVYLVLELSTKRRNPKVKVKSGGVF